MHLKAGDYLILEADTTHEAVNNGTEPYCELLVTNPIPKELLQQPERSDTELVFNTDPEVAALNRRKLNTAAESLKISLLRDVSIPFCLFDSEGNVILKNDVYPSFCLQNCDPVNAPKSCACYSRTIADGGLEDRQSSVSFFCPYGIRLYLLPLIRHGILAGTLLGGHHFSSAYKASAEEGGTYREISPDKEHYDTPYATELSIEKTLQRIVSSLQRYCDILDSMEALTSQRSS